MSSTRKTLAGIATATAVVIGGLLLAGGATDDAPRITAPTGPHPTAAPAPAPPVPVETTAPASTPALELAHGLATIDDTQRIPDYRRDSFGSGWADLDRDGCNTRQEILQRDMQHETLRDDNCTVLTGTLADPYTGTTITFAHDSEGGNSQAVEIDHIVSLSAAHQGGAWAWTKDQRVAFANDERVLLAVDGPTNSSKNDHGPADWMPENIDYWCGYAEQYTTLVAEYELAVAADDRQMLIDTLTACA